MYKILISDKKHELYGQILTGGMLYCDIRHTGNSEDLYVVHKENGETPVIGRANEKTWS